MTGPTKLSDIKREQIQTEGKRLIKEVYESFEEEIDFDPLASIELKPGNIYKTGIIEAIEDDFSSIKLAYVVTTNKSIYKNKDQAVEEYKKLVKEYPTYPVLPTSKIKAEDIRTIYY